MSLTRVTFSILLSFAILPEAPAMACEITELSQRFASPDPSTQPHVFWYWINGNISREGITADLEAMKRAGIGGAMIFNIGGHGVAGPVKVLSPEWRELMRHAILTAKELGIEITLNNSMAGWSSSGGPWITPDLAMQKVTWSETTAREGNAGLILAQPPVNLDTFRDIAVVAFPTPMAERGAIPQPVMSASGAGLDYDALAKASDDVGGVNWDSEPTQLAVVYTLTAVPGQGAYVQWSYPEPFAARSLHIAFGNPGWAGRLGASNDGAVWWKIQSFTPRTLAPVDLAFICEPSRYWRVVFDSRDKVDLTALLLSGRYRIAEWSGKAMYDSFGLDRPAFTDPALSPPGECVIARDYILDLTDKLGADGRLDWIVPPGEWTILRFGYTPTGSMTGPASEDGGGLECDKMNPAALDTHFKNSLQPWFDDPDLNAAIQYVHVDSYERGAQNWTTKLPEEFLTRQGYDLRNHLPVLAGRVVDNLQDSERFLWDYRKTLTTLTHENYFGRMAELCREAGKQFSCEPYHQDQFDTVTVGGAADIPMCEAWMGKVIPGPYWYKRAASPAHIFGKRIAAAEACTAPGFAGGDWSTDFNDLKPLCDAMFCGGVNRLMFHVYVHQPWMDLAPGETLAVYGTHFERTNTWWEQMPAFTSYITRCQSLLQSGRFVADLLYSCGENSPNASTDPAGSLAVPPGYDYDVCDAQTILNRLTVSDGRLVLPEGASYRVLALPEDTAMTPAMVRRIGEIVQAGAVVIAPKPTHSPSMTGQPEVDVEVRHLAEVIWGPCDGVQTTERSYGAGRLYWGKPVAEVLTSIAIPPDFFTGDNVSLRYIHASLDDGEYYFVMGQDDATKVEASFRTTRGTPWLWDPVNGMTRELPLHQRTETGTVIPLEFEPRQSYFVVFRDEPFSLDATVSTANFPGFTESIELTGPWEVSFDPRWGGPESATFDGLRDWTTRPEPGIKYYSGTATYRKSFIAPPTAQGTPLYLDLGKVRNVATVRLNGQSLGIIWCAPWRVEITGATRSGENQIEIDVVNLWPNRMIGDEQLPPDCEYSTGEWRLLTRFPDWFLNKTPRTSGRYTFSMFQHFTPTSPLLESGLMGPVKILRKNPG